MTVGWWDVWSFLDAHVARLLAMRDGRSWRWDERKAGHFDPDASTSTLPPLLLVLVGITTAWRPGRNMGALPGSSCPHTGKSH